MIEGRINGNLNLSRALGDMEYKKDANLRAEDQIITAAPDLVRRVSLIIKTLSPDDKFVIMGCDGIWERYSNQ